MVSTATRDSGSLASRASRMASLIWSQILSGWPSVTDSEVKSRSEEGTDPWDSGMCSGKVTQLPYWLANGRAAACVPMLRRRCLRRSGARKNPAQLGADPVNDDGGDVLLGARGRLWIRAGAGQNDHGIVVLAEHLVRSHVVDHQQVAALALEFGLGVLEDVAVGIPRFGGKANHELAGSAGVADLDELLEDVGVPDQGDDRVGMAVPLFDLGAGNV